MTTEQPLHSATDTLGRPAGFAIDENHAVAYAYDMFGRFQCVTASVSSASLAVQYSRLADSDLLEATSFTVGSSAFDVRRSYEPFRSLVTAVSNSFDSALVSAYGYENDELGRRTSVVNTGLAFSDAGEALNLYGYNPRSEVTDATRHWGTDPGNPGDAVAGQSWVYDYDPIGNRTYAERAGYGAEYTANELNQYTGREVPGVSHILGTADEAATVTVNTEAVTRQDAYWYKDLEVDNETSAAYPEVEIAATYSNLFTSVTGRVFVAETPEAFTYDDDGNLTQDSRFDYTWNGENRLIKAETREDLPAGVPRVKVEYAYDHQGRRIAATTAVWTKDAWQAVESRDFIYDGWNVIRETVAVGSGSPQSVITNLYTWGLDLSGSIQGAGGIGGLLAVSLDGTTALYCYDANGNVGQLVGTNADLLAHYEYSPFGETIVSTGSLAEANPFRFSTKQWDDVTGLGYWGYRYYHPDMGRWASRDPIGEKDNAHIYSFVGGNAVSGVDWRGLRRWPWQGCCGKGKTVYNRLTHCCRDRGSGDEIVARDSVRTGVKRCNAPRPGGGKGSHYWIEIDDDWSAGFYGDPNKSIWLPSPGIVSRPEVEGYVTSKTKECEEYTASPCDYDFERIKEAIKAKTAKDVASPPNYQVPFYQCMTWSAGTIEAGFYEGAYPEELFWGIILNF